MPVFWILMIDVGHQEFLMSGLVPGPGTQESALHKRMRRTQTGPDRAPVVTR
jgi:hypothetical protein